MNTRITQIDIARVAGVHNTTVSLALRNSPAIPAATRQRIQAIAQEMGYAPDPALQALVAYRNGRVPNRRQALAYVTNWHTRWGWQEKAAHAKYYAGAQRQAAASGFQLEHFWLGEPDMTPRRLSSMFFHRNIAGLLLASFRPNSDSLSDLDWSRLSAVKIGCFPSTPDIHEVADDPAGTIRQAMKRATAAGYERIGMVLPHWRDELADEAWSTAFLGEQSRFPVEKRISILQYGACACDASAIEDSHTERVPGFEDWISRHQPDVIMSFGPGVRSQLQAFGYSVPNDVAYVDLFLEGGDHRTAGMRENCERIGEVAIQLLVSQMQQNSVGIPAVPTATVVKGIWIDGSSLPSSRSPAEARRFVRAAYADCVLTGVP